MTWNTKRDGYYTRPASANLGHPVDKLEPHAGHTHAVIIPGTSFKMFVSEAFMQDGKADKFLKALARTNVPGVGNRKAKAAPVMMTVAEYLELTTTKAA